MKISKTFSYILGLSVFLVLLFIVMKRKSIHLFYPTGIKNISVNEAYNVLKTERPLLLDVRNIEEYEVSHLEGALRYDSDMFKQADTSKTIITYCTVGVRSAKLTKELQENGFSKIYNMDGGIIEWKNKGYDVVDMTEKPTDKVHVYNGFFGLWLKNGEAIK